MFAVFFEGKCRWFGHAPYLPPISFRGFSNLSSCGSVGSQCGSAQGASVPAHHACRVCTHGTRGCRTVQPSKHAVGCLFRVRVAARLSQWCVPHSCVCVSVSLSWGWSGPDGSSNVKGGHLGGGMVVRRKERRRFRFSRKRRKGNPGMREREPHRWVRVDSRPIGGDTSHDARRGYPTEIMEVPLRGRGRNGRNIWNIRPSTRRGNGGRSPWKSGKKGTNSSAGYVRFLPVGRSV